MRPRGEGIFLGRGMTLDTGAFIFDIDAEVLRKLSRGAQQLYVNMRRLADGKTGELAINGAPLDWRYIARQSKIGRYSWLKYFKELRGAGLVWVHQDRVTHSTGRRVLSRAHYFVRRQALIPKNIKNQPILLKSDFRTVRKPDPQYIQKHPEPYARVACAVDSPFKSGGEKQSHHQKHLPKNADDDLFISPKPEIKPEVPNHFERLQDQAKNILLKKGQDPDVIDAAFEFIEERAEWCGTPRPVSPNYYVTSYENLDGTLDMDEVLEVAQHRKALREKYMPGFTGELSEESEQRRREFNYERKPPKAKKKTGAA